MKLIRFLPLLFLTACSTRPKIALRPLPPSPLATDTVRYPEIVHAYHLGRYVDPNDDLVMHEQHVVYRVEANSRWNFHPGNASVALPATPAPHDAAFNPAPVNDAVLAEVNAQKLATVEIMIQTRTLSSAVAQFQTALQQTKTNLQQTAALRAMVGEMKQQLAALAATQRQPPPLSPTNEPPDSLSP
jgi:hypothetical protein